MREERLRPNDVWSEYTSGMDYKTAIDLYDTVKVNENMYLGKQWEGVNAPDLPKPVLNIMKRVVSYQTSMIVSDDVAVSLTPHRPTADANQVASIYSTEIERIVEQAKVKDKHRDIIRNAAVDGDACLYLYFDPDVETGQDMKGDIRCELVENINVYFGNPYVNDVQKQPYIIIAQRRTVKDAKAEAKKNGIKDWELITADEDTNQQEKGDSNLCTVLIRMWKENGTVHVLKTTREVMVQEPHDMGYRLYPISWMSWERVKSSYHGQATITGLVPNQISINRLFAMTIRSVEANAFPKIIFDKTRIKNWSNRVGEAIAANGDVSGVLAQPIRGGDVSSQVMQVIDSTINLTRDFMGASDAALGNVKPDNTSAIIAVQQASAVPLELQKRDFFRFVNDYVEIIMDIMRADYGVRTVTVTDPELIARFTSNIPQMIDPLTGMPIQPETPDYLDITVDFGQMGNADMTLKVDVGAAAYWSELMQVQTLDNLFGKGIIQDAVTYLEGIPDKYLKNKQKIISHLKERQKLMEQQAAQQQMMQTQAQMPVM